MGNDEDFLDGDVFYPSDFEDDVENLVGVEEFLFGVNGGASSSSTTFQDTYFEPSDYDETARHEEQWEEWQYDENEVHEGHEGHERHGGHEGHEGHEEVCNDNESERYNDFMNDLQEQSLPLFEHVSIATFPKYAHFTHATIKLMIECVQRGLFPTYTQICEADPNFIPLLSIHGRSTSANIPFYTTERWKKLQGKLKVIETSDGMALSPIGDANDRMIPPIEYWYSIVEKAHVDIGGKHLLVTPTINAIRAHWSTDIHVGGIHTSFIQSCLQSCQKCQGSKWWDQILTIPHEDLVATLDALCLQHIVLRRRSKCIMFKRHTVTFYRCHRGGNKNRAHRKKVDAQPLQDRNSRRERKSRLCNCCFQIKIVEPRAVQESKEELKDKAHVTIYVHTKHSGHQPSSDADSFFLPVHPYVISWAMENLKYMYSTAAVAAASERDQELFRQSVEELDRSTYRFHIMKTEVQQLAYSMRVNDSLRKNDWDAAQVEISRLQAQGKVIYYQPYAPTEIDPRKRPFVVVIQDEFMKSMAERFSRDNSWALDSTFKTNQYGLPLYAAVVPNQDGKGIPVFYMLCSNEIKEGHEGIALELALTHVFAAIGEVRPSAIVIDKHKTSLTAITNVVNQDLHCWIMEGENRVQVAGRVLLCHFHVMKAWSENLLTRVPMADKDRVWQALNVLMHCPDETHFDENLRRFAEEFAHIPSFGPYIFTGWAGSNVPWKRLWPKFGRLFSYGGMDTTNHVERHWELIKYTLLQGKVNRSLRDLIVAIVGSAKDGTRVGQPTLLNQFKMTQRISDSERFSRRGNDNGHRRRLKGGERIFKSYQSAPSNVLQVMDEAHLLFRVQSESNDGTWYNVSLNTHFCDCPDRNSTCKHILGVQLIVKGYFKATRENEIVEEMMPMEEDIICAALISPTNMGVEVGGPSVLDDSSVKLLSAIAEAETLLQSVKTSIGDHTEDEKKHKVQVLQKFLTSFSEPFTFERPATIDLPRRGSISVIQENVKRTRMGHGKKRVAVESVEEGASQPPFKRPSHMLISHSKQKRAIFRKLPKVTCEICATKTLVEGGATSISCKNCDHQMFV